MRLVNKEREEKIITYFMQLTSHRGDSGMKNSPGISIVHGSTPEKENISEFNRL